MLSLEPVSALVPEYPAGVNGAVDIEVGDTVGVRSVELTVTLEEYHGNAELFTNFSDTALLVG